VECVVLLIVIGDPIPERLWRAVLTSLTHSSTIGRRIQVEPQMVFLYSESLKSAM